MDVVEAQARAIAAMECLGDADRAEWVALSAARHAAQGSPHDAPLPPDPLEKDAPKA